MNHRKTLRSALLAAVGLRSTLDIHAQATQLPAPPAKISVTRPSKPYHVTEITASGSTCDSTQSSTMQIGGIPRPTLTLADSRWQCLN